MGCSGSTSVDFTKYDDYLETKIGIDRMREVKASTISKWSNLGFLDGLNDYQKNDMTKLYESQASQLLNETISNNDWGYITSPIVRRDKDLVPLQAMSKPVGQLFYFDYQFNVKPVDPYLQYKIELIEKYKNK